MLSFYFTLFVCYCVYFYTALVLHLTDLCLTLCWLSLILDGGGIRQGIGFVSEFVCRGEGMYHFMGYNGGECMVHIHAEILDFFRRECNVQYALF